MKQTLKKMLAMVLALCMILTMLPVTALAQEAEAEFYVPAEGWTIVNEDDNLYINDTDSIIITTQKGDFSLDESAGYADNYWIRTPADEDFVMTLKVSGGLNANWQKAGIMVFKDDDTIASVVRRYHSGLNAAGNVLGMFQYLGGFDEPVIVDPNPDAPVYLKLEKSGSSFTGYYRFDEADEWVKLDTLTNETVASYEDMKIGVFAINGTANNGLDVTLSEFTYNGEPVPFAVESDSVPARVVKLSASSLVLDVNQSETLTANVFPVNTTDTGIKWESSDETVATVENGKVVAKAAGSATITATCGDASAECQLTVYEPITGTQIYLSDLEWESANAYWTSVKKDTDVNGSTIELDGVTYSKGLAAHADSKIVYNIEGMGVTWFLADIGLDNDRGGEVNFVIEADGVEIYRVDNVKGSDLTISVRQEIPEGTKKLTLITEAGSSKDNDHSIWADAQIVVAYEDGVPVSSIEVATSSGRTSFATGDKVAMVATVIPETAADSSVSWSVAPADGAEIDNAGNLTVTKAGTYTVTASANDESGVTGSIMLTFVDATATWTVDSTTKSGWIGTYGSDGYVLCAWDAKSDVSNLPYYIDEITYTFQDRSGGYIAQTAANSSAGGWEYGLAHPDDPDGTRKVAYQFDDAGMTVHIVANDEYEHQLTFYCVSENDRGRQQTVTVLDPETGDPISDSVTMTSMHQGKYITITFSGSVDVLFHNDNYSSGKTNVVVNGIFFDTVYEGDTVPVRRISMTAEDG